MKFQTVTLFPQIFESLAAPSSGLIGQAVGKGLIEVRTHNPRAFAKDVHQSVDDRVFGGGDGMVQMCGPWSETLDLVREQTPNSHIVFLTPQGRLWSHERAKEWAREKSDITLVCGRYGGFDHRLLSRYADEELSIGDYVLNGGEAAAWVVIETISRFLPGVLGKTVSAEHDSLADGLLECPQFTRPREALGLPVPSPLLGGNHKEIAAFQKAVQIVRTTILRPDLMTGRLRENDREEFDRVLKLSDLELSALGLTRIQVRSSRPG